MSQKLYTDMHPPLLEPTQAAWSVWHDYCLERSTNPPTKPGAPCKFWLNMAARAQRIVVALASPPDFVLVAEAPFLEDTPEEIHWIGHTGWDFVVPPQMPEWRAEWRNFRWWQFNSVLRASHSRAILTSTPADHPVAGHLQAPGSPEYHVAWSWYWKLLALAKRRRRDAKAPEAI